MSAKPEEPQPSGSHSPLGSARWGTCSALVLAHPGHELLVHGWLERARPVVFVLTDGSGRTGRSRLASTTGVLRRAGARPGAVYGHWSDAALYAVILEGVVQDLYRLVDALAEQLVGLDIDFVVGDALEGYNPCHDLARYVVNAAVRRVTRRHRRTVGNYEFLLAAPPTPPAGDADPGLLVHRLDDAAFRRKVAAARGYTGLQEEIARVREEADLESFRVECVRPVDPEAMLSRFDAATPFYETWGARRVSEGHYSTVIRYREHVRPLARALWAYADER